MSNRPRRRTLAALVTVAALTLAGCGGDEADTDTDPEAGTGSGSDSGSGGETTEAAADAFPVSIENKFGTTEIEAEPETVVSVGFTDQDFILALGVVPTAVRYWYGDEEDPFRDWADDALAEAGGSEDDVEILNMPEINFERIRAEQPDVIIAMYAGLSEADYDSLTDIAPVVTQTDEYADYGTPWQDVLTTIGTALGRLDRADELVADIEGRVDAAAEANPQWAEQTLGVVTGVTGGEFGISVFSSQDPRSRFFTELGFSIDPQVDEIAGDLFYAQLSSEQLDLIDTDVAVWDQLAFVEGGRATVEADPLIQQLSVVQDERVVWLGGETEEAFGWQSPLSLPIAIDDIVGQLETVAP